MAKSGASKGAKKAPRTGDLAQGANYFGVPKDVRDAAKRQYKGGPDYTIEDKKKIINHYKGKA